MNLLVNLLISLSLFLFYKPTDLELVKQAIVVIDTGIPRFMEQAPYMCKDRKNAYGIRRESAFVDPRDPDEDFTLHGRNVIGLIGERIDQRKYCIISIRAFAKRRSQKQNNYLEALKIAYGLRNVIGVNLSLTSGSGRENFSIKEFVYLKNMAARGSKIVVAAGNDNIALKRSKCFVFPACLILKIRSNFYTVGSKHKECQTENCKNEKSAFSNWALDFHLDYEYGESVGSPTKSGTSQATAIKTGKLFSR